MKRPKEPHCALICGRTKSGKTKFALDLLSGVYRDNFEYVVILCPTLFKNKTYYNYAWITSDERVVIDNLSKFDLNKALNIYRNILVGFHVLFIIDDCSARQDLKYRKGLRESETCELSNLAMSGRHDNHSCWLLTQKYNSVLKDFREQTEWIAMFYCKDEGSFTQCMKENKGVPKKEIEGVEYNLKTFKYTKLILKTDPPVTYQTL